MEPPAEYLRLAYLALVVAQHERRLDDISQCGHLLVTKHQLEQRKDALRKGYCTVHAKILARVTDVLASKQAANATHVVIRATQHAAIFTHECDK